jgi:hypothetical protein
MPRERERVPRKRVPLMTRVGKPLATGGSQAPRRKPQAPLTPEMPAECRHLASMASIGRGVNPGLPQCRAVSGGQRSPCHVRARVTRGG